LLNTPSSDVIQLTFVENNQGIVNKPDFLQSISGFISDPVNTLTGQFYVDAPDLALPGPMPLVIRRNYLSQNLFRGDFGMGWKSSLVPYLVLTTNSRSVAFIYAAEMDGSVIAYRKRTNAVWVPTLEDNPTLNNNTVRGVGSGANLFNARIERTFTNNVETYTLRSPEGSWRNYE